MSQCPIIQASRIHKRFQLGEHEIHALKGVDLDVQQEEFLAIAGSSGSGKTTLLNLMGCIDFPTSGKVFFEGEDVHTLSSGAVAKLRAEKIGFIFPTSISCPC